ncbi:hypothetical protein [uncultured Campylobacter sp.]|uniref:hypothetical protein n=1 Tax=uncultured Campylobacter sp. TaxID=218934 RepID=UPI00261ABBC6|nr:hypothetical protein [uncultured Campylobacter sp.]
MTNLATIRGRLGVKFARKFKSTSPSTAKFQKRITARQKRYKILPRVCFYVEVNFSRGANPLTPRNLAETKGQCFEQNQPKQGSNFS